MRWITILGFAAIVASSAAQSADTTGLETQLRAALRERWTALARHDVNAYGACLDDEVVIPDNGFVYDKKALIERARSLIETGSEPRDVHVHGDNNAAVMIYRTTSRIPFAGRDLTQESRVVETYVKRNGRWLLTARAESDIPNANRVAEKIDPKLLDDYVGEYEISPNQLIKITRVGDRLMEQGPDDAKPEEDLPLSPNSFFQREQPGILTFLRAPGGKVESYVLWIYDTTVVGKKIK